MKKRNDLLLIAGLLAAAALLWVLARPGGAGGWAVIIQDGTETARYPLDADRTVTIGGEAYNVLRISGGRASVIEANCGDHTCVRTGAVSREGETIVCLPHRLVVRIEGGVASGFDASVG
ncbi:MAG: NusG domain II-containing protein [Oscillospiraceae bacterium]|jgi:hypothetical protein|nr:NusG domain II-containing protein [Oscillospiraceae bacterium]